MNADESVPAPLAPATPASATLAAACRELRAGRSVSLISPTETIGIAAVETAAMHDATRLVLAAGRVASLGVDAVGAVSIAAPPDPALRLALADPTRPQPETVPLAELRPADPAEQAALELCKLAELLPAALTGTTGDGVAVEVAEIEDWRGATARALRPVARHDLDLPGIGPVRLVAFKARGSPLEHLALLIGRPEDVAAPLARLHSACFTGDVLGSMRCDCGEQLAMALARMAEAGAGVLLYLDQEGRGIGLANKLRAYRLQDDGLDTVDANQHLGFEPDERDWTGAATMLRQLGFGAVRLLTNNPEKLDGLGRHGIDVVERVAHAPEPNPHNLFYLRTKALRRGHLLDATAIRPH